MVSKLGSNFINFFNKKDVVLITEKVNRKYQININTSHIYIYKI